MNWFRKQSQGELFTFLNSIKANICAAAQQIYDQWDASDPEYGDFEVGFGGICHLIADSLIEVIDGLAPMECEYSTLGRHDIQHVYVAVVKSDGTEGYSVDIHPSVYETGAGFTWDKIPDVQFEPDHVSIYPLEQETITGILNGEDMF